MIALQCCVSFCCTMKWIALSIRIWSGPRSVLLHHGAEFPVQCSRFPLSCLLCTCRANVSVLLSQVIPPSPSSAVSTDLLSANVTLFLSCREVRLYHFFRLHIYVLIYNVYFPLSDLPHYPHLYKQPSFIPFYGWVIWSHICCLHWAP